MSSFFSFLGSNTLLFLLSFAVSSPFSDESHKEISESTSAFTIVGDLNLHSNISPTRRASTFTRLFLADLIPGNG